VTPAKVKKGKRAKLAITVTAKGVTPTGKVTVAIPGHGKKTVTLKNGKASLKLPAFKGVGRKVLTLRYAGNARVLGDTATVAFRVVKKK
jgi:5'-nucleotidase